MEFHQKKRQVFLGEDYYHQQLDGFHDVIDGPQGLEENLQSKEVQPGWHASLAQGVGFEKFNRLLLKYTAGEPIEPLRQELEEVVAAYERYGEKKWADLQDRNEPVFDFEFLDDYCILIQLIGLCFLLHRRDLLPRIAALQDGLDAIGPTGNGYGGFDWLFEEFMSFGIGPEKRFETDTLCFARPYDFLADAMSSDDNEQALKDLHRYLKNWYKDLAGAFWHDSHKPDEAGNVGGYYGYWSFEAGAAALLLGIEDDSSLHQYLYYPKDLIAWAKAHADLSDPDNKKHLALRVPAGQPCLRTGFGSLRLHSLPVNASSKDRSCLTCKTPPLIPFGSGMSAKTDLKTSLYGSFFWHLDTTLSSIAVYKTTTLPSPCLRLAMPLGIQRASQPHAK